MEIGEASRRCGLPAKTIRYYEDVGLIHPDRKASGYRRYRQTDIDDLVFVGRARMAGFTVAECSTLLNRYRRRERATEVSKLVVESAIAQVDRRISELRQLRKALHEVKTASR